MRIAIMLIGLFGLALSSRGAVARAYDYDFDPVHSQAFFQVSHLGFSTSTGRFGPPRGSFRFDRKDWANAACDVRIAVASLDMGDSTWTKALLGKSWFAAKQFPDLRFVCERLQQTDARHGILSGQLSIRGVTRPVDFALTLNRAGMHKYALRYVAGFGATARIRRSDFGMLAALPEVGEEIRIELQVEGFRRKR
ncbi:MAG: YceI family protein [Lysobacterales bacterium]